MERMGERIGQKKHNFRTQFISLSLSLHRIYIYNIKASIVYRHSLLPLLLQQTFVYLNQTSDSHGRMTSPSGF